MGITKKLAKCVNGTKLLLKEFSY